MTTQFYLADPRFMKPQEMELAESYDDSAFLCSRHLAGTSEGKVQILYSLGIPTIILYNLPRDTRIVNNNNAGIQTIGDLLDSIKENGIVEHMEERQRKNEEGIRDWLLSRPDLGGWHQFRWAKKMVEKDPKAVPFPEKIGAMQYIDRK